MVLSEATLRSQDSLSNLPCKVVLITKINITGNTINNFERALARRRREIMEETGAKLFLQDNANQSQLLSVPFPCLSHLSFNAKLHYSDTHGIFF